MTHTIFKTIFIVSLFAAQSSFSQKPEEIYSHAQVRKPNEFYHQQIKLWKKETEKNKADAHAWYNYYKANRYAQATGPDDSTFSRNRFKRMENVVNEIDRNVPNSFEAHFIKWANGYNDWSLFPELEKAYAIDPGRWETYDGFINYYEMQRNIISRDEFLKKLYESEKRSPGMLNYNYNVLMSLAPNAILLTSGDNDTYFAWMLQAAMGIRKDVLIVNTNLASMKQYAQNISKELGIQLLNTDDADYKAFAEDLYKQLLNNKAKRPVYAGVTVAHDFIRPVENNLYLIGLVYQYSTEKIDNIALLKKNMEKLYELDYLNHSFAKDPYESIVAVANTNYIVPMLTLYNHYKLSGEMEEANLWKAKAEHIAKNTDSEQEVKDYFKEN